MALRDDITYLTSPKNSASFDSASGGSVGLWIVGHAMRPVPMFLAIGVGRVPTVHAYIVSVMPTISR